MYIEILALSMASAGLWQSSRIGACSLVACERAGALVWHLDVSPRHAGVIAAAAGTAGAAAHFTAPALRRVLRAARQVRLPIGATTPVQYRPSK